MMTKIILMGLFFLELYKVATDRYRGTLSLLYNVNIRCIVLTLFGATIYHSYPGSFGHTFANAMIGISVIYLVYDGIVNQ